MKTGKLSAKYDKKALHISEFESPIMHPAPAPAGFDSTKNMRIVDWGMLGNDEFGDCVWAGSGHETEILTFIGGKPVQVTTENCLSDYGSTGFNPNDPNSDKGTDMGNAMSYRRKKGILDSAGIRHKIGAYIQLEPGNWLQLLQGLWGFGVVGIGIEFPQSAMDQFNAKKDWTVVKGSPIDGGHYIPGVAHMTATTIDIITWGKKIRMSKAFYEKYNDESYIFVSTEDLRGGKSPAGYNMTDLNALLTQITSA